jgi:hypothetical protein
MPDAPPEHTDAEYYGMFMTALSGLVDDAELSGYSLEGISLLRSARERFMAEFLERRPDAWRRNGGVK